MGSLLVGKVDILCEWVFSGGEGESGAESTGRHNKRTLAWLCRQPTAAGSAARSPGWISVFFPPSLGPNRTVPADLRVTGPCGGKWTAVAIGGVWGWRRVRKRGEARGLESPEFSVPLPWVSRKRPKMSNCCFGSIYIPK